MRLALLIAAVLLIALSACAAPADAPPAATTPADDAALKDQVVRLVQQLDAAEITSRKEARDQLVALGPKILDLLPTTTDGQAQADAVESVRAPLQLQLAEKSIQASNVTLNAVDQPLSEILAALSRQSGNKLKDLRTDSVQRAGNPRLTLAFNKTPFWQALDQTLDRAHLTAYPYVSEKAIGIDSAGESAMPRVSSRTSYAGPLRFEATRLTAIRGLGARRPGSLNLMMEIAWEPRLRPIMLQIAQRDIQAVDDRGQPIAVENPERQWEGFDLSAGNGTVMEIPLVNPPRSARAIAAITGTVQALLPARTETFEFTGFTKNRQHRAGVTVTLDEPSHEGPVWQIRVGVAYDHGASSLESFREWNFDEAYIVGPDNRQIKPESRTASRHEEKFRQDYTFLLPNGPGGLKLIYKTPALLTTVPLKFEFKDLPLP